MVVQGIIALALALPTGMLFGVGYGTGVRIGYEQVYPLLFPQDKDNRNVAPTVDNIKKINGIYDAIGGKEASQMGIAKGLNDAMSQLDNNPDFQALVELEWKLSGRMHSRLEEDKPSKETSISDFPSDSSLNPDSPNFDSDYYIFVLKEQGDNAQTETNLSRRKHELKLLIAKLSKTQLQQAYSDMLSNRLQPSWAQTDVQFKQLLTVKYKQSIAGTTQVNREQFQEHFQSSSTKPNASKLDRNAITFQYQSWARVTPTSARRDVFISQTYAFDFTGHVKRLAILKRQANLIENNIAIKKNRMSMLLAYNNALNKAYPNFTFKI